MHHIRHLPQSFKCFSEYFETRQINLFVINILRIVTEIARITLFFCQKSLFYQGLQINKIWISCKSRERLVRRISISRRSKWKNLPVALAGSSRRSTNSYASFEKHPIPYRDGSEATGSKIPLALIFKPFLLVVFSIHPTPQIHNSCSRIRSKL